MESDVTNRALPIDDFERETELPNPPLKAMLGQIRFPTLLRAADPAFVGAFHEEIAASFPEIVEEQSLTLEISPGNSSQKSEPQFRFVSQDERWSLVLNKTSLTLEAAADRYTSYEQFKEHFATGWDALLNHFKPGRSLQQGLRYIDHIEKELTGAEWAEFVNTELLGAAGNTFGDRVQQSITDLRLALPLGNISLKHGIVQGGPEGAWGYLLDYDYFSQEPSTDVSTETVLGLFDAFHEELYALFRWCVTEKAMTEFRA